MPDSSLRVIVCSFLSLTFQFCPPLKNDGRSEMRFANEIEWKLSQKERMKNGKLSPDTGKVSAELTKGASWSRNVE